MHKNRRFVSKNGYKRDLKQSCSNVKLRRGRIGDICWLKSGIVMIKEPQNGEGLGESLGRA